MAAPRSRATSTDVRTGVNPVGDTVVSTNASGNVDIPWTGTVAGNDTLRVYQDVNANNSWDSGEPTDVAFVNFNRGSLFISTSSQDNIGAMHSATFTLEDGAGNPRQDVTIHYSITGANPQSEQTTATDSSWPGARCSGRARTAGFDTIERLVRLRRQRDSQDGTDPSDAASVEFSLGEHLRQRQRHRRDRAAAQREHLPGRRRGHPDQQRNGALQPYGRQSRKRAS